MSWNRWRPSAAACVAGIVVLATVNARAAAEGAASVATEPSAAKLAAVAAVDRHARDLEGLSDRIWAYA